MSDIEEIKSRLDIVDVVNDYVPLKRAGQSYKACCPFHKEKTPSFVVTPAIQRYKCFGCGESGDALNFIQQMERVDFAEALRIAADKAGYELKNEYSKKDTQLEQKQERLYELNSLAAKYWNYILKTHKAGKPGRNYLQKRKIRSEEIDLFQLGYAPKGTNLIPFLLKKGFTEEELISAGLAVERKGNVIDKFRERFMMSIMDSKGRIVAFSGRITLPSEYAPKYLNSPETLVYKKGEILMGLHQAIESARSEKKIILEEGNIDLLSSHKVGVGNIVATGGTALTQKQVKLLKRYADTVLFAFDTDSAGIKALVKGIEFAEMAGISHRAVDLRPYGDPDDLISDQPDEWKKRVEAAGNSVEYLFDVYAGDLDLGSPDGKSAYVARLAPVIRSLKDAVQKSHFEEQLALAVGATKTDVQKMISDDSSSPKRSAPSSPQPTDKQLESTHSVDPEANVRETYLLALLVQLPDLNQVDISGEVFTDANVREIFNRVIQAGSIDDDFLGLVDNLSDGAIEVLQRVLSTELNHVSNTQAEFNRVYKMIYGNYLRAQILDMRRTLKLQPESTELLSKLQFFTSELKSL